MASGATALSRVVVLLTALVALFFLLLASRVQAGNQLRPTTVHVVQEGETLWEIAESLADPADDIRVLVFDLKRMNGLSSAEIAAGDRLVTPLTG